VIVSTEVTAVRKIATSDRLLVVVLERNRPRMKLLKRRSR
jgi:hypothetical protein